MTDDIIIALVKDRISQPDCENGFLFDGFPRTIPQADALVDQGIDLDAIVEIAVPFDEIIKRMSGRRVHPGSGRTYHVEYNPPAKEGVDDETGEPLIQREDDQEDTVRDRLKVYEEQTSPSLLITRQKHRQVSFSIFRLKGRARLSRSRKSTRRVEKRAIKQAISLL